MNSRIVPLLSIERLTKAVLEGVKLDSMVISEREIGRVQNYRLRVDNLDCT